METTIIILLIIGVNIMPFFVTAHICKIKNRNVAKGLFVTLFFGWFATAILWLALKRRNRNGVLE